MATFRLLNRATNGVTVFRKLFAPVRSVSAVPSIQRSFNTHSASVDEDRHSDSCVSRPFDHAFFPDMFGAVYDPMESPVAVSKTTDYQWKDNPVMKASLARNEWEAEENEFLSFRFCIPGLDKDHIKITVEQDALIIKVELENDRSHTAKFLLPVVLFKLNEIEAEMKSGLLKIKVPKVKAEENRKNVLKVEVQ